MLDCHTVTAVPGKGSVDPDTCGTQQGELSPPGPSRLRGGGEEESEGTSSQLGLVVAQLCALRTVFDAAMHLRAAAPIQAPQVTC